MSVLPYIQLRSCATHRIQVTIIYKINKCFESAIEKETMGRKQAVSGQYKERLESRI